MKKLRRISPPDFLVEVLEHVRKFTEKDAWADGANHKAPFYFVEMVGKEKADTKTFNQDKFTINIHCIAGKNRPTNTTQNAPSNFASEAMLEMVGEIEAALENKIFFHKNPFQVAAQDEIGYVAGTVDPSGEPHGVVQFEIIVRYGLKIK